MLQFLFYFEIIIFELIAFSNSPIVFCGYRTKLLSEKSKKQNFEKSFVILNHSLLLGVVFLSKRKDPEMFRLFFRLKSENISQKFEREKIEDCRFS